ncbi:hypothetical protein FEM48_Zijuj05G0180400 [Ziziphus jujuba var. spinosa]|uniref:Uncharacterized protein n=1 Tax=Ziziphus jujuba var. spinosa TaxID=714518 RepID=A0A978VGB3_ZIZJJ|nr:hypothetical protein FEM48_Zijuj05G0180400 [Ziziphus jujuba var. spinosa]
MGDGTEDGSKIRKKMIVVALWCIQMNPNNRPTMNRVKEMLEGDIEILQMPPKPFLCSQEMPLNDEGLKSNSRYSTPASDGESEEISEMNLNDRPTMNSVKEILEGDVKSLQMPPKPFLYPQEETVKPINDEGGKTYSRCSTPASDGESEEINEIVGSC